MQLARLVLPTMRQKRRGRILMISSVSGLMAMPTMAVYSASKFALEGGTESLWYEVRPWGIKVSIIQSGFIRSSSILNVRLTGLSKQSMEDEESDYHAHYKNKSPFIAKVSGRAYATHERVAKKVIRTMQRRFPPLRVAGTFDAKLFYVMRRVVPRRIYHALLYTMLPHVKQWGPIRRKKRRKRTAAD